MEKFNRTLHGYDPVEVNNFLDGVISQVEKIIALSKEKDKRIAQLEEQVSISNQKNNDYDKIKEKLEQYMRMEETLNRAILMAQKTSEQMKLTASHEGELIIDNAKKNANRIVNDALIRADQTERESELLKHNINTLKRRLKDILEQQLEMVDEIEKIDI